MQKDFSKAMLSLIDNDCEKAVIGALINYPSCYFDISDVLKAEAFTDQKCRAIYDAVSQMIFGGQTVEPVTLFTYISQNPPKGLKVDNWAAEIAEISYCSSTSATVINNVANLNELWQRRQALLIISKYADVVTDRSTDIVSGTSEASEKFLSIFDNNVLDITTAKDAINEMDTNIKCILNGENNGVMTGLRCIDECGGLIPSHYILIAAYSSQGKSSLALQVAISAAIEGNPIAFYTMEMTKSELMARATAADAKINVATLIKFPDKLTKEEWTRYEESKAKLENLPIYFDEKSTTSIECIIASIRTLIRRKKIKGVVIDYLQILGVIRNNRNETTEEYYGRVTRIFKDLARQENIFVILLSQLSRDHEHQEPKPEYLRGSGQIYDACDECFMIFRPEVKGSRYVDQYSNVDPKGTAQIQVCKCRNGNVGQRYILGFKGEYTQFYEFDGNPPMICNAGKQNDKIW